VCVCVCVCDKIKLQLAQFELLYENDTGECPAREIQSQIAIVNLVLSVPERNSFLGRSAPLLPPPRPRPAPPPPQLRKRTLKDIGTQRLARRGYARSVDDVTRTEAYVGGTSSRRYFIRSTFLPNAIELSVCERARNCHWERSQA